MIFSSHRIIVHGIHFPMIAGHNGENAEICDAARNALGQARSGATIVSVAIRYLMMIMIHRASGLSVSMRIF